MKVSFFNTTTLFSLLLIGLLGLSSVAMAQFDDDEDEDGSLSILDMLDMNLEELMQVNVLSVVDSDENLRTSSLIRLTERDMIEEGYYTLQDVLERTFGMTTITNDYFLSIEQRGVSGNLDKVQLLVNGREVGSIVDGAGFVSQQFATHNISYIEITKGAQGVISGANAFTGTINIFTKNASSGYESTDLILEGGGFNTKAVSLSVSKAITDDLLVNASVRIAGTDGADFTNFVADSARFSDQLPRLANSLLTNSNQKYTNHKKSIPITGSIVYKDFYVGMDYYYNKIGNKGQNYVTLDYNNLNEDNRTLGLYYMGWQKRFAGKHLVHLEYQHYRESSWGSNYRFDIQPDLFQTYVNENREEALERAEIIDNFGSYYDHRGNNASQRNRLNLYFNTFVNKSFCIHAGYMYENNTIQNATKDHVYPFNLLRTDFPNDTILNINFDFYKYTRHTTFLQLEQAFFDDKLFFIGGVRWTYHSNYQQKQLLNFKLGAIYQPHPTTYFKLFFNQGFREPTLGELTGISSQVPNALNPANINNYEVNLIHQFNKAITGEISSYYSTVNNAIVRGNNATNTDWINSTQSTKIMGVESELRYRIRRARAAFNYTFTTSDDGSHHYSHRGGVSIMYKIIPELRLHSSLQYYPRVWAMHGNPEVDSKIEINSFMRLNFTATTRELDYDGLDIRFSLSLQNAFGGNRYQPNVLRTGPRQFLGEPRTIMAKMILKYK